MSTQPCSYAPGACSSARLRVLPGSPRTCPHCRHRVMPAVTLAPSRRRLWALAALPVPWPLPQLGPLVGKALVPALLSQLPEAEVGVESRERVQGEGQESSPSVGWLDTLKGWLQGAGAFSMGPEDSGRCRCQGPGLSPTWGHQMPHPQDSDGPGWDSVDGQILGQLSTLADEEEEGEEDGAEATFPLGPAFPAMDSEELRLASFHDWPLSSSVHPSQLAEAGFFHTGPQDKVRCFFCCGGLQSWEHGDDPWTEHAKWFPRCEFLLQSKGRGFVRSVQDTHASLQESWDPLGELEELEDTPSAAAVQGVTDLPTVRRDGHLEGTEDSGAESPEEQLRRLQQERTCKVCLDRAVGVVFVPCGHLVCPECAPNLNLCPICRAPIRSCVRTFLS